MIPKLKLELSRCHKILRHPGSEFQFIYPEVGLLQTDFLTVKSAFTSKLSVKAMAGII